MTDELVEIIHCPKCSQDKPAHNINKHLCVDCVKAENSRVTYYRQHQGDWIAEALTQGIDPWLRQPGETQWEYTVWMEFRDSYPGKQPKLSEVARKLGTTHNVVSKIAQRWTFQIRMQHWIAECDRLTMLQRKNEVLVMNKEHVDMAKRLREKLSVAINAINPSMLKPNEIGSLLKTADEIERKARIDTENQEVLRRNYTIDDSNPNLKKKQTNTGDLSEIVNILMQTGAIDKMSAIGVKETTTTTREVVATKAFDDTSDDILEVLDET